MAEGRWRYRPTKILSVGSGTVACTGLDQPCDGEKTWKMEKEGRRKKVVSHKCNENVNLPYCGKYLSVNYGKYGVAGIVAEGKNIRRI